MDDDVARVDQDPIAKRHPLDFCIADAMLLQLVEEPAGNGADMALRTSRGDNHVIAKRRLARQADIHDIVSFGVLKRVDDQVSERGGSRSGAFCAARSELGELSFQRVKPQREDPSLG